MLHNLYCQIFLTMIIPTQKHISLYDCYLIQKDESSTNLQPQIKFQM